MLLNIVFDRIKILKMQNEDVKNSVSGKRIFKKIRIKNKTPVDVGKEKFVDWYKTYYNIF